MSNISIFKFEESFTVRTVIKDNEPWFVAKDVCDVLGLTNPSETLKSLDNDEKTTLRNSEGRAGAGVQCFNIINESGLYAQVIRSNKPNARKFRKWITSEVLPAIRKTGAVCGAVRAREAADFGRAVLRPGGDLLRRAGDVDDSAGEAAERDAGADSQHPAEQPRGPHQRHRDLPDQNRRGVSRGRLRGNMGPRGQPYRLVHGIGRAENSQSLVPESSGSVPVFRPGSGFSRGPFAGSAETESGAECGVCHRHGRRIPEPAG